MDRQRFDIIGIDTGSNDDAVNVSIRAMCRDWINIVGKNSIEAARRIAEAKID